MICPHCGSTIDNDCIYCTFCGKNTLEQTLNTKQIPNQKSLQEKKSTDKSIIYWITSIVSLGCSMFNIYLELILSIATIILIVLDRKNIKKEEFIGILIISLTAFLIFIITIILNFIVI